MEIKNYGVIPFRRPRDLVAADLPYQIVLESGNWNQFLPPGEWQRSNFVDTMACVSFSLINCIETQEMQQTGKQINYSDRWIAMMSGTTQQGNYLTVVAETIRKYGLVKEESWPAPANYTWDSYYAVPDAKKMAALKAEGLEWLRTRDFKFGWVGTDLNDILKHLKHTPLQVVTQNPGHARENFNQQIEVSNLFDTYSPFIKQIQRSLISDVLKPILIVKDIAMQMVFFKVKGKPALYEFVNNAWRGYDDPNSYSKDIQGKDVRIIELDQVEFDKLTQLFPI